MTISVLFEDDAFLAIHKPPFVVVNRAQSVQGQTVQDWVEEHYPTIKQQIDIIKQSETKNTVESNGVYNIEEEFASRSGIVHRIDKETSGILLIAKHPHAFGLLKTQFLERTISKTYIAFVHGKLDASTGEISAPVGRLPWNREHFGVLPEGREAVTSYEVIGVYKREKEYYSLVKVFPKTGRTHQIRVHFKYINHPLVADMLYAGRKTNRQDRSFAPRVMLHAASLTLMHPITGMPLTIDAPVPDDFSAVLSNLTQL